MSYCRAAKGHPFHGPYHDREYGFPVRGDAALFERLALEINQAGLSWLTMLQKRDGFRRAFEGFDPETVAAFDGRKVRRLLSDAGIIRNRLKVRAVIENAKRIVEIQASHGSFGMWLEAHHPRSRKAWQKLFKETFVFTGGEIVGSFLLSTGYLRGAHVPSCPVYGRVAKKKPAWATAKRSSRGAWRRGTPLESREGLERDPSRSLPSAKSKGSG
jgi:DNA-3-methyladenine glycosylase I